MAGLMCYDWKLVIDNVKGYQVGLVFVVFILVTILPQICDISGCVTEKRGRPS